MIFERLIGVLKGRERKYSGPSVIVGYTQEYAIYVHENMEARHKVGQAKFLEQPVRQMAKQLGEYVRRQSVSGVQITDALLLAGLRLQRASQELVPVDTGALKGSAFTRVDNADR